MHTQSQTRPRRVFGRPPPEVKVKPLPRWARPAWARARADELRRDAFAELAHSGASSQELSRALAFLNERDFYAEALRESHTDAARPRIDWWHKCLMESAWASGRSLPDEARST